MIMKRVTHELSSGGNSGVAWCTVVEVRVVAVLRGTWNFSTAIFLVAFCVDTSSSIRMKERVSVPY